MNYFKRFSTGKTIHPQDRGIFDPFLPLPRLKAVSTTAPEENIDPPEEPYSQGLPEARNSMWQIRLIIIVVGLIMIFRLVDLQITKGKENFSLAEGNRLRTQPIPSSRGLIFDKNGQLLVRNVPSFTILVRMREVPKRDKELSEYAEALSKALEREKEPLQKLLKANLKKEILILDEGLDRDKALRMEIRLSDLKGIEVFKSPNRQYVELPSIGHILGYIGKVTSEDLENRPELLSTSMVGKSGLEYQYDTLMQGVLGVETVEVDSLGRELRVVGTTPEKPGFSLLTTLDSSLQRSLAFSIKEAVEKTQAKSAAAVIINPNTGDVLAMVSYPDFDNNLFSFQSNLERRKQLLNDPTAPMLNRVIAGQYPSGSTIKPVVAAGALEEGVINQNTRLDTSEGKIMIGQWTYPDWKVHGITDVRQAIAESNNIFFYALGGGYQNIKGLGMEKLVNTLHRFGFGQTTGIDLPGEKSGLVPDAAWKKKVKKENWYTGDSYNLAIGQGDLLVTPLQLTRAISAIANGGRLIKPRLVKTILYSNNSPLKEMEVKVDNPQVVSAEHIQTVREGMRRTITGTGLNAMFSSLGVEVAAKTGTAQFDKAKERTHSWFTCFAPYGAPEIALSVIVEGAGEGYQVAAPVALNALQAYYQKPLTPINPPAPQENP